MKGMKRIFGLGCLIFSLLGSNAWASLSAYELWMELDPSKNLSFNGSPGQEFILDLKFYNRIPDLGVVQFAVNYNPSDLQYVSSEWNGLWEDSAPAGSDWSEETTHGEDYLTYTYTNNLSSAPFIGEGEYVLAGVRFKIVNSTKSFMTNLLFSSSSSLDAPPVVAAVNFIEFDGSYDPFTITINQPATIPVPSAGLLFGATLLALTARRRRIDCA